MGCNHKLATNVRGINPLLLFANGRSYSTPTRADSDMPPQSTGTSRGTSPHSSSSGRRKTSSSTSPPPTTFGSKTHLFYINTVSTCVRIRRDEDTTVGCDTNQLITQVEEQVRYHSNQVDDSSLANVVGCKTFDSMDFKGTDGIPVDEWLQFCVKHIIAKAATLAAHPILVQRIEEEFKAFINVAFNISSPEYTETYWFLLELSSCDVSYDVSPRANADNARQGTLPQRGGQPDGSRDVSPPADADNDRQGTLSQNGDYLDVSHDVSSPMDVDNVRQGTLYQGGDKDLNGAKEREQEEKETTQLCNTAHVHSATC